MSIGKDINVCGVANVLLSYIVLLLMLLNSYLSIISMFYRHKSLFAYSLTRAKQTNKYELALFGGCMYVVLALYRLVLEIETSKSI